MTYEELVGSAEFQALLSQYPDPFEDEPPRVVALYYSIRVMQESPEDFLSEEASTEQELASFIAAKKQELLEAWQQRDRPILVLGDLQGPNGNAYMVLARAWNALRESGRPKEEIVQFIAEATSGNYEQLLRTVDRWFDVYFIRPQAVRNPQWIEEATRCE